MRKEYRKAVRAAFTEGLAEAAPGFERVRVSSPLLFGGETVFRWSPRGGVVGWLLVVPDAKRQAFTVEVGWSSSDRFPEFGMRPSVMLGAGDPWPVEPAEGFVRLGGLANGTDRWWELPDPAMERLGDVEALAASLEPVGDVAAARDAAAPVADALAHVTRYAVPFLEELAATRGPHG